MVSTCKPLLRKRTSCHNLEEVSLVAILVRRPYWLSPLIKWYLERGLEVTHFYQVVEYTPIPCFQPFGEAVSDARRAVDPTKAIIADTMKLVSCSPIEVKEEEIRFKEQKTHINVVFFQRWGTRVMERR